MSALVDSEIERAYESGSIVIEPFDRKCLGTNSYDVHLASTLLTYRPDYETVMAYFDDRYGFTPTPSRREKPLDVYEPRDTISHVIYEEGFVLQPGELYLASTVEYTESHRHLPILNGKSSIGRLGLSIHVTAGTGDVGFCGHWTMELFVIKPLRVYAGMAIGQLLWFTTNEAPEIPYDLKKSAKYNNRNPTPMASMMYQELSGSESEE